SIRRHTSSKLDWSSDVCSSDLHVHPARPEIQEPLQLVLGAGPIGPQVEVQAILDALALRDLEHVDARPAPVTGRDADAVRVGLDHLPAQHCAPEVGDEAGSGGVDDDDGWTTGHGLQPASPTALREGPARMAGSTVLGAEDPGRVQF